MSESLGAPLPAAPQQRRPPFRLAAALALAFAGAIAATAASAEVVIGGNGGQPFQVGCGKRFLVGLAGTASDALESLRPICAKLDPRGQWVGAPLTLDQVGGNGGEAIMFRSTCPRDTVVEGFDGYSGQFVYHVKLWCRRYEPDGSRTRVDAKPRIVGGHHQVDTGENGGCGPNQAANGIIGRSGSIIDAFGVTCGGILVGVPDPVPPMVEDEGFELGPNFEDKALPPDVVMPDLGGVITRIPEGIGVDGEAGREVRLPQDFTNPNWNGIAVDHCASWGKLCGKPAADHFCRSHGWGMSAGYQIQRNAPPTISPLDGAICREAWCVRMVVITCNPPPFP